jgi:hypothetical protein
VTHFHKLLSPFWLPKGKILSGFAIRHPGQCRVPLLVLNKFVQIRNGNRKRQEEEEIVIQMTAALAYLNLSKIGATENKNRAS